MTTTPIDQIYCAQATLEPLDELDGYVAGWAFPRHVWRPREDDPGAAECLRCGAVMATEDLIHAEREEI